MTEQTDTNATSLKDSLQRYGLAIEPQQQELLDRYCQLLWRENRQVNLTRHVHYDAFVARDLNDVLQISHLLAEDSEILDIGSGGGVPGIALAIIRPDLKIQLCESVGKKARALERMIDELGIRCTLFHGRAESLLEDDRFDAAVARAVGPLWKICRWFQDHWLSMGRLFAFKGAKWESEVTEARKHPEFARVQWRLVHQYPMLGTESMSYILKLWAKGAPDR